MDAIGGAVPAFPSLMKTHSLIRHVVLGLALALSTFAASQPLPQGKANFSVTLGNMDSSPWVRLGNWTFNGSAGTVAATFWSWFSTEKHDVQVLHTHTCTFDGVTRTCNAYTPYGWMEPAGQYMSWGGTYTYDINTGRLAITWTSGLGAGNTEQWDVTLALASLARVKFVSGSSTYNVTHGRGYGSNASWSIFKTISEMPTLMVTSSTGRRVAAVSSGGSVTITPASPAGAWVGAAWGLDGFTTPSAPDPKNTLHAWKPSSACSGPCQTTREGIVYHLSSRNNGRQMSWVNFCACLSTNAAWPGYNGNMHPHAMQQIIDDGGNLVGLIGIEAQNPPSTGPQSAGYPNFQMQLWDLTTVAGS